MENYQMNRPCGRPYNATPTSGNLSSALSVTVSVCRLHRASDRALFTQVSASRSIKVAFQGVTPSFDYSCV